MDDVDELALEYQMDQLACVALNEGLELRGAD